MGQVTTAIGIWISQVVRITRDAFTDLEPQEYMMLLIVTIAVGYVLLKGRH